jgi:hypothetical protein
MRFRTACWRSNVLLFVFAVSGVACTGRTGAANGGSTPEAGQTGGVPAVAGSGGKASAGTGGNAPRAGAGAGGVAGLSDAADAGAGKGGTSGSAGTAPPSGGATSPGEGMVTPRDSARVLLSGHSLTDNPIGDYVALLAERDGRSYGWEQQIVIGSPLRFRTRGESSEDPSFSGYSLGKNREGSEKDILGELAAPTAIAAGERYDTLVVTERHDIMDVIRWEDTVPLLRHYHDRVREHESGARTLFYQSWPDIDHADPAPWIAYQAEELAAWECAASKVNLSLERDGAAQAVGVVPVALTLAKFVERALAGDVPALPGGQQERLRAIFTDDVHVTSLGAFVAAAATYATVFQTSPVGLEPPSGVDAAAAAVAAEVAWEVVSGYLAAGDQPWRRGMADCRSALSALCPQYMAIRDRGSDECNVWGREDGPMSWPDDSFPLPAP